jgi:hypothetical protein
MMPAKSEKQKKFMDAAAHNPAFAKQAGIPVSVAKEFSGASKGLKFGKGSDTSRPDLQKVNKPKTLHGKMSIMKEGGDTMATKKMNMGGYAGGGAAKSDMKEDMKMDLKQDKSMMQKAVNKHEGRLHKGQPMTKLAKGGVAPSKMGSVKTNRTPDGVASKGRTKGKIIKMNMGGKPC